VGPPETVATAGYDRILGPPLTSKKGLKFFALGHGGSGVAVHARLCRYCDRGHTLSMAVAYFFYLIRYAFRFMLNVGSLARFRRECEDVHARSPWYPFHISTPCLCHIAATYCLAFILFLLSPVMSAYRFPYWKVLCGRQRSTRSSIARMGRTLDFPDETRCAADRTAFLPPFPVLLSALLYSLPGVGEISLTPSR
jgi:hypothetical protein